MCIVNQNLALFNSHAWISLKPGMIFDWGAIQLV